VSEAAEKDHLGLTDANRAPAGGGEAPLLITAEQLRAWRAGLSEVVEWLAGPELFYRTGYYDDEVTVAIAAFGEFAPEDGEDVVDDDVE
jgi:hypothetical protein